MADAKTESAEQTKNLVRKLLSSIFILGVLVSCEILVLIHGWGLQPKSWWWIIGVGFFANLFLRHLVSFI